MNRRSSILVMAALALQPATAFGNSETARRIGILISNAEGDTNAKARITAFVDYLKKLGWNESSKINLDVRWTGGSGEKTKQYAQDLVNLDLDLIVCTGATAVKRLYQATKSTPIIFVEASDPVATGAVSSMNNPGRNITGFTQFEFAIGGKWLELLNDMRPNLKTVCVFDAAFNPAFPKYLDEILVAGRRLSIDIVHGAVNDYFEFSSKVEEFSQIKDCGMIVMPSGFTAANHRSIVDLTTTNKLPTIYPFRFYVDEGGLFSYGIDLIATWQKAALYADRILRGAKPSDLPVQSPDHFELIVNITTAEKLGLRVPLALLAKIDEEVR